MSIAGLLERGVRSVLDEPGATAELGDLLVSRAMDPDSADHVRQTLRAMPGLLVSVDQSLSAPDAPTYARDLFLAVLAYMLDENNLIPSHAGKPLYGLLDDVYLLHLAALELEEHLGRVDLRSVAGGADLLEHLLPREVIVALRTKVHEVRDQVRDRAANQRNS